MKLLDNFSYRMLIIMTLFLGLAPFAPEPHVWEKIKMLISGGLTEPIDIFDLIFHATPAILLLAKYYRDKTMSGGTEEE